MKGCLKKSIRCALAGLVICFSSASNGQQLIHTYSYTVTPEIIEFAPASLPPIATVFASLDAYALPWFAGAPTVTDVYPVFGFIEGVPTAGVSEQLVHQRVINFCGQTNVMFKIRSGFEQDLSWIYLSPDSNPEHATEAVGLPSGDDESAPTTPYTPKGGMFIRGYVSDDTANCAFYVEWFSDQQPFWKPLNNGEFVGLNTYGATVLDSVVCGGDSTTVFLDDSDLGTSYVLRDDADDAILDGPLQGNGGALAFNTGAVLGTTTYNILSLGPNDALFFDGVDDFLQASNQPDLELTDGTIEVWLRPASTAGNQTIIAYENPTETSTRYKFSFTPGLAGIEFDNGSGVQTIAYAFTPDVWQEISIVDNSLFTEVFVDAVSIGTFSNQFGTATAPDMLLLIGSNGSSTEMFNGDIEEVRIWNVAKSSTAISAESDSCMMGSEGGLVALYPMEDGYGSTEAKDVSTIMNNASLMNMDVNLNWVASTPETCSSCDVQMYETVTVYNPYAQVSTEICEDDSLFLEGAWQNTAGVYFDTLVSIELGCDSIVETTLGIQPEYYSTLAPVGICSGDSILVFGAYESAAGIYYDSLNTLFGCDSVFEQQVSVNPVYFTEQADGYICPLDSELVFGSYVYLPGVYQTTLSTVDGCDSLVQKTLLPAETPPVGILDYALSTICSDGGGVTVPLGSPSGGVYSGPGVTGTVFDPAGLSPGLYYTTYTYTSLHGCSSSDSAFVFVVDCLGVDDLGDGQTVSIFPNPNDGNFTLRFAYVGEPMNIAIYNALGSLVFESSVTQLVESVELPAPSSGSYLMVIRSETGVAYRRIVVE